MIEYFFLQEHSSVNKYMIRFDFTKIPNMYTTGSYCILESRVLGISYANYCRLCRDEFGATIYGKGKKYPVIYFNSKQESQKMLDLLNDRMNKIMEKCGTSSL